MQVGEGADSSAVSVIVPVNGRVDLLRQCLAALSALAPRPGQVIVVIDGDDPECACVAAEFDALSIQLPQRSGAAAARNAGARAAHGSILFFVDADVAIGPDAVRKVADVFARDNGLAALFGSYDDAPRATNFFSQYKNLFHHYTHQSAREEAFTFWTACGAVRREVFFSLGGFCIGHRLEDIELGYRLRHAGHRIVLLKELQAKHLKRWGMWSFLRSDLAHRAIPWASLILQYGKLPDDLNLSRASRVSVLLAYLLMASLLFAIAWLPVLWVALGCTIGLLVLNARVYSFFQRRKGLLFAAAVVPWHWIYYLCGGLGFAIALCRTFLLPRQSPPVIDALEAA